MIKTVLSALAIAALALSVGATGADAKSKKKRMAKPAAAGCTASPLMRDESRLWSCWPMQQAKADKKKKM